MEGIRPFYKHKSVLLTGATGFLGKVILEKIVRSCSEVSNVYVLIRSKRDACAHERLQKILSQNIYQRVRGPNLLKKIVAVEGDLSAPDLGLTEQARKTLISEVGVVIHSAANVKFDCSVASSVKHNIIGSYNVIELASQMKKLQSFVHVSTVYTNARHNNEGSEIKEMIYPRFNINSSGLKHLVENHMEGSSELCQFVDTLEGSVYQRTKGLSELLLREYSSKFPIVIVRPSAIVGAWKEPEPGWVEAFNGVNALYAFVSSGLFRYAWANPNKILDIIPVDVVSNMIIAAGWDATNPPEVPKKDEKDIRIYHCGSSDDKKFTYGEIMKQAVKLCRSLPNSSTPLEPDHVTTTSKALFYFRAFTHHYLLCKVMDWLSFLRIKGKNGPLLSAMNDRYNRLIKANSFIVLNEWIFCKDNVRELQKRMSPEDEKHFYISLKDFNYAEFATVYWFAIRKYLLKNGA